MLNRQEHRLCPALTRRIRTAELRGSAILAIDGERFCAAPFGGAVQAPTEAHTANSLVKCCGLRPGELPPLDGVDLGCGRRESNPPTERHSRRTCVIVPPNPQALTRPTRDMRCAGGGFVPMRFSCCSRACRSREYGRSAICGTRPTLPPLMSTENTGPASSTLDFEALVERYYRQLYQFAYNLSHDEAQAYDLTQETFLKWARKGHQLRDPSKVKTWLFTTLHREFLQARRKTTRFPHHELDEVARELPVIPPTMVDQLDAATVLASLAQINEAFRAPLALFYLEDYSYKEIADILDVPIGTVQSRIARGKTQLYKLLTDNLPSLTVGARKSHG